MLIYTVNLPAAHSSRLALSLPLSRPPFFHLLGTLCFGTLTCSIKCCVCPTCFSNYAVKLPVGRITFLGVGVFSAACTRLYLGWVLRKSMLNEFVIGSLLLGTERAPGGPLIQPCLMWIPQRDIPDGWPPRDRKLDTSWKAPPPFLGSSDC